MDASLLIAILALFITTIGTAAAVAGLNDEGRARLVSWTKSAASQSYKIGAIGFVIVSLVNGSVGVYVWSIDTSTLTRRDVLTLILFLLNIGIGLAGIHHLIEQKKLTKEQKLPAED